jgi:lipopolysaccharide/colanic/teichoic acid biosynthesis glycosyltransferase
VSRDLLASAVTNGELRPSIWNRVRHAVEPVIAATCLALMAPTFLLIALAIKLQSRGPILDLERRYGYKNKSILIRKFRTRAICDEQTFGRLTPVGRFLEFTGIEDLPKLCNVVVGEMSFVGSSPTVYPNARSNRCKPGIAQWSSLFK